MLLQEPTKNLDRGQDKNPCKLVITKITLGKIYILSTLRLLGIFEVGKVFFQLLRFCRDKLVKGNYYLHCQGMEPTWTIKINIVRKRQEQK